MQHLVSHTSGTTILAHMDAPEIDGALRALERSSPNRVMRCDHPSQDRTG